MRNIFLTKAQMRQMIDHAARHAPLEACGLLAGANARVEKVFEVSNQAKSPVRFVMDPLEQLAAFEWIESNGMELLGIFHSHPTGPETVSPTDINESAYAVVNVILSPIGGTWQVKGYWIEDGQFEEVALMLAD